MISSDVELMRTVDLEEKDRLVSSLVRAGVSYLEKWEKIPFFSRREYYGAKEICVVFVNDNQKELAQSVLEKLRVTYGESNKMQNIKKVKKTQKKKKSGDPDDDFNLDEEI